MDAAQIETAFTELQQSFDAYKAANDTALSERALKGEVSADVTEKLDTLAGLRPALKENAADLGGQRILDGRYTAVRQAVGTKPQNQALQAAIKDFLKTAKADGTVAGLLEKFGVQEKLSVAKD